MIVVANFGAADFSHLQVTDLERSILQQKQNSPTLYRYKSIAALLFELRMRSRIVDAARALNASGIRFATFETSQGREPIWFRTENGGLQLNPSVPPSDGIRDIFYNGRAYAIECATAIVVVLYKAVLDSIGDAPFNIYFRDLLLYDWQYDSDLRMMAMDNVREAYPGDVLYFKNPDYNPEQPQWQGENTVLLPGGLHYGHGIGIRNEDGIIAGLNRRRRPGSTVSAYVTERVVFPDFEYLRRLSGVVARIGSGLYVRSLQPI